MRSNHMASATLLDEVEAELGKARRPARPPCRPCACLTCAASLCTCLRCGVRGQQGMVRAQRQVLAAFT